MRATLAYRPVGVLLALGLATSACSTVKSASDSLFGAGPDQGTPGFVSGFLGGVVADEPRAALAGREVLSAGGNAADAAVAVGFAMAVTLPSRAGLGGGGACLAYSPDRKGPGGGVPEAVIFTPVPGQGSGDRPAAVPMLARGLFALHARYGSRPFESLTVPAEEMARFGVRASRALVRDLDVVAAPLGGDPGARAVFFHDGRSLAEGDQMVQPALAATLAQLRVAGVGDLYQGVLARKLISASAQAGGSVTMQALRTGLPKIVPALTLPGPRGDTIAFLPPPADGGLATAAAYQVLQSDAASLDRASQRALGVATRWRQSGGDPEAVLKADAPAPALPLLPASASFVTLDREGNAVSCVVTMDNLFGTGRIAPDTGIVLAASPATAPLPLLSAALAWNNNVHAFHAAVAASGQEAAPLAAAVALNAALTARTAEPPPGPGRANEAVCPGYLPGEEASCRFATDPRNAGLVAASN
jgi:gamma-glutamyltranspeptidase / glutathione hydrolase